MSNNTFSRAELEHFGTIKNIHYGDILIKFGDTLDATNADIPYIKDNLKFKADYLQNGDLIIADTAEDYTAGKSTEIYNICDAKVISGLHTIPCRPQIKFAEKYLGYYTNSPAFRTQLLSLLQGIKVFSISKSNLNNTNICYPSLSEQQKIADFLSLVDARIEKQRLLVESLKKYKRGALSRIFNDVLETVKLSDISNFISSTRTLSTTLNSNKGIYPVYDAAGISGYIDHYDIDSDYITIVKDGSGVGRLQKCDKKSSFIGTLGALVAKNCTTDFLYAVLQTIDFSKFVTGMAIPHIYYKDYKNTLLPFPCEIKQHSISKFFKKIDEYIENETQKLSNILKYKQGLLQQMFI